MIVRKFLRKKNREDFLLHKNRALVLAKERLLFFNKFYQFNIENIRIKIKNQKTRWGSYSKKGSMNFNYRIVHLPLHFVDSIIVHELCHVGEFSHSRVFWNLVYKTIPNYRELKRELNKRAIILYS